MKEVAALSTLTARDCDRSRSGDGEAVDGAAERGGAASLCKDFGFIEARHSLINASLKDTC